MKESSLLKERATSSTTYWVDLPHQSVAFRLNKFNPEIDAFLAAQGQERWAFLTAYNPRAHTASAQQNQYHQRLLIRDVANMGLEFLGGSDVSDDGGFPPERCIFILGISVEKALQLAARHRQAAIVVGERGQPARLIYAEKK